MIQRATTRECERLFRHDAERRGHRFGRYKNKFPRVALDVHNFQDNGSTLSALTAAVTLNNVTAGDLLVCMVTTEDIGGTLTLSVSDSLNGAWTAASSLYRFAGHSQSAQIFYRRQSLAGNPVITLTSTISAFNLAICAAAFLGMDGAAPFDQAIGQMVNLSANATSGNVTTTADGDLVYGGMWNSTVLPSAGAGFTFLDNTGAANSNLSHEWGTQTSKGATAATFVNTSDNYIAIVATFKATFNPNLICGNDGPAQPSVQSVAY